MSGAGATIAFGLKGGLEAGRTVMDNVRLATLAVSLGGVESLIEHPASMTHAGMSREQREDSGITDGLVRYSVGIESVDDLIADLAQALREDRGLGLGAGGWGLGTKVRRKGLPSASVFCLLSSVFCFLLTTVYWFFRNRSRNTESVRSIDSRATWPTIGPATGRRRSGMVRLSVTDSHSTKTP